jgi:hypothetical protein
MENLKQTNFKCEYCAEVRELGTVKLSMVKEKLIELFNELYSHGGYGQLEVDMKILKRGQKEIILRMGKEFRFVVDFQNEFPLAKKQ